MTQFKMVIEARRLRQIINLVSCLVDTVRICHDTDYPIEISADSKVLGVRYVLAPRIDTD